MRPDFGLSRVKTFEEVFLDTEDFLLAKNNIWLKSQQYDLINDHDANKEEIWCLRKVTASEKCFTFTDEDPKLCLKKL